MELPLDMVSISASSCRTNKIPKRRSNISNQLTQSANLDLQRRQSENLP